jgi:hypothetical protein
VDVAELAAEYTGMLETELGATLTSRFVQLFRRDEEHETFRPHGSAFLLRIADLHLLVTAAHLLDDFLIHPKSPPPAPVQTFCAVNHTTWKQFEVRGEVFTADRYDVGIIELR